MADVRPPVLIIDDDQDMRWALRTMLQDIGLAVTEANAGTTGLEAAARARPAAVLLDMRIPGLSGEEVLADLKRNYPVLPVIVITGYGSIAGAVNTIRAGAFDYLTKPFDNEAVISSVRRAIKQHCPDPTGSAGSVKETITKLMGSGPAIQELVTQVETVVDTDYSVVIGGETGTGKEIIAQVLHRYGPRRARPFVVLDCGTISDALVASEFFGHERGAYTGAHERRRGRFEVAASGGTLFLDEIGNLCVFGQRALLRVLEERVIYRVGSTTPIPLDTRLIAATNEALGDDEDAGAVRSDLFYRLSECMIIVPPLRKRPEDIEFLAYRFLRQAQKLNEATAYDLAPCALDLLRSYPWPGNVRQLRNVIRRAGLMTSGKVTAAHIQTCIPKRAVRVTVTSSSPFDTEPATLRDLVEHRVRLLERDAILDALTQAKGNKTIAARRLGIDYKTFRIKLKVIEQHVPVDHDDIAV